MTQTKKMPYKTNNYPLFSLKMRQFGYKSPGNRVKTPSAVTIHRENFCPKKFTGKKYDTETGLYYYGARYLDSKTSRWLSGDPAMGDYVPSAPVNDEARKRNGNLPGQGGVFNYVNLHVYHYAGNNPVKYVDPDGRSPLLYEERNLFIEILGTSYVHILDNVKYTPARVTEQEINSSISGLNLTRVPTAISPNTGKYGISLPGGKIFMPSSARSSGFTKTLDHMLSIPMLSLLMHELFHQIQYDKHGTESAFQKLLDESALGGRQYDCDLNSLTGKTIWDISNYEAQGKFVEDFTLSYLSEKGSNRFLSDTKKMAQILKDSGFSSTAINTVLNSP